MFISDLYHVNGIISTFDLLHPEFANDPRHVRLGLASDGFNPFETMSTSYCIWPGVLIPYNRLPWEFMKQTCPDQSSIIDPETDLRHRALMYGNERGSLKVGPRRTY